MKGDAMKDLRSLWVPSLIALSLALIITLPLRAGGAPFNYKPTTEPPAPASTPTSDTSDTADTADTTDTTQPAEVAVPAGIYVNEFMADANRGLENPDKPGEYPDWFELYNAGDTDFSLDGLYLTDSQAEPTQYAIPDGLVIPAKGFIVFYADSQPELGPLHLNFALGRNGEFIGLYDPATESFIDGKSFSRQQTNVSEGRVPDGGVWNVLERPSPGASNAPEASDDEAGDADADDASEGSEG
jgi:hypothetical protein